MNKFVKSLLLEKKSAKISKDGSQSTSKHQKLKKTHQHQRTKEPIKPKQPRLLQKSDQASLRKRKRSENLLEKEDNVKVQTADTSLILNGTRINNKCSFCNATVIMNDDESALSCGNCGMCIVISGQVYPQTKKIFTISSKQNIAGRKAVKMIEYLNSLLSLQRTSVDDEVVLEILSEIMKQHPGINRHEIEPSHVRDAITTTQFTAYILYTTQIFCNITATKPPKITSLQKGKVVEYVNEIEKKFDASKTKKNEPFFTLSYVFLVLSRHFEIKNVQKFIFLNRTRVPYKLQQEKLQKLFTETKLQVKESAWLTENELKKLP
jgi:ribosomal protein S27AE